MKIVMTDNFARETVADFLVCTDIDEPLASKIVDSLNSEFSGETSPNWFRVYEDDRRLWRGMEELI